MMMLNPFMRLVVGTISLCKTNLKNHGIFIILHNNG